MTPAMPQSFPTSAIPSFERAENLSLTISASHWLITAWSRLVFSSWAELFCGFVFILLILLFLTMESFY